MKETDNQHLASYRQKQQTVVDRVTGIINRRHNGLYVWGETGVGKTWNIEETLKAAQSEGLAPSISWRGNARRWDCSSSQEISDAILFIDDDPTLVKDTFTADPPPSLRRRHSTPRTAERAADY